MKWPEVTKSKNQLEWPPSRITLLSPVKTSMRPALLEDQHQSVNVLKSWIRQASYVLPTSGQWWRDG